MHSNQPIREGAMEALLKQRLIGGAIVIALAVVLLPMILDGVSQHRVPDIPGVPKHVLNNRQESVSLFERMKPSPTSKTLQSSGLNFSSTSLPPAQPSDGYSADDFVHRLAPSAGNTIPALQAPVPTKAPVAANPSPAVKIETLTSREPTESGVQKTASYIAAPPTLLGEDIELKKASAGWSVQIASFNDPTNASLLKKKLDKAGFQAYILPTGAKSGRGAIYRVRIGPEVDKDKARAILARVKLEVRLNGFITSNR